MSQNTISFCFELALTKAFSDFSANLHRAVEFNELLFKLC